MLPNLLPAAWKMDELNIYFENTLSVLSLVNYGFDSEIITGGDKMEEVFAPCAIPLESAKYGRSNQN